MLILFLFTEKHKTYHIKDEQLTRDGFKKFMKQDPCPFEGCRFSGNCNHIHCIRSGCSYVLHSSGQLFSHKRKHERKDSELAYRKYKLAQSMMKSLVDGQAMGQAMGQAFADQFGVAAGLPPGLPSGLPPGMAPGMAADDVGALHSLMAGLGGQAGAQPQHGAESQTQPADAQNAPGAAPTAAPHPLLALQQHLPSFRLPGLDMLPPPYMLEGDKPGTGAPEGPADLTRGSPTATAAPGAPDQPPSWHTPQSTPQPPQQQRHSPQPGSLGLGQGFGSHQLQPVSADLAVALSHSSSQAPEGSLIADSDAPRSGRLQDEALWQRVSWRFSERCPALTLTPGSQGCELVGREHWHCRAEGCGTMLRTREAVLEHARNHDAQDQVSEAYYVTVAGPMGPGQSPSLLEGKCHCDQDCPYQDKEKHYHCTWVS